MANKLNDISLILKDLLKVIKVVTMYPEDNPLPQSLKRSFSEKLVMLAEIHEEIKVYFEKGSIISDDEVVYTDKSKEENLAGIFFNNGITNLTFKAGIDVEDIYKLLDVLKIYHNAPNNTEDLVSLIWEAEINCFQFTTVEDIALSEYEGDINFDALINSSDQPDSHKNLSMADLPSNYKEIFKFVVDENEISLDDSGEIPDFDPKEIEKIDIEKLRQMKRKGGIILKGKKPAFDTNDNNQDGTNILADSETDDSSFMVSEAVSAMGYDDITPKQAPLPDTTMILNKEYQMSQEAENIVRDLRNVDSDFDGYESTLELLKEMLHQETEATGFNETVTICEKITGEFLKNGKLLEASLLLKYMMKYSQEFCKQKPLWQERINDALLTLGTRDRLINLTECLNNYPDLGSGILRQYLENFGWEAYSGMLDMLGQLSHEAHREGLCNFLASSGKKNINILSIGMQDTNTEIVNSTITILARIADNEAFNYLSKGITHKNSEVRLSLAQALSDSNDIKAINILTKLATDNDPDVRKQASISIGTKRGQVAFDAIAEIINAENFEKLELGDQKLLLIAFSKIGGELAVKFLKELILKYNVTRNSQMDFYRDTAFEALSINRSEKAEETLLKLCSHWRPNIKQMAQHALHIRRGIMYGDDDDRQ